MMRSFAKKLAFVMAAAMVVTTAAPAGQAAHAATKLDIALQTANSRAEAVESYNIEVGETVNFKFYGAADYKEFDPAWTSDLEDVATVDQGGKVTGQKDGIATITFGLSDGREGEVVVTVGNPTVYDVALGTAKDNTFTELTLEEGEEKDLNFYGVKDYKKANYDCTWTVEGDAVSIDKNGVVTAEKAGEAVVSLVVKNKTNGVSHNVASVVVTVPEKEVPVDNSFEAAQISDTVATLTFANKEITAAEVAGLEFYYYVGEQKIAYPVQVKEVKDGVVTVESYVFFADGTTYGFKLGEETSEFTATIGEVAAIEATWSCDGDAFKAYIGSDTVINAVLKNAQGVDITASALANGGSVTYSLVNNATNGEYWISDLLTGKVFFNAKAVAQVKVSYVTGKYDEVTYLPIPGPETTISLVSSDAPAYAIDMAKGAIATLIIDGTNDIDWNKASTVIALNDEDSKAQRLVVKMCDNKGNDNVVTLAGSNMGTFTFQSTNNAILSISPDGIITTNGVGTANVLVRFQLTGATTSSVVAVVPVTVKPERAVTTVTVDKAAAVISTEAGNDGKKYNEVAFTFTLKDQLGANINAWATELTCNNANALPNGATEVPGMGSVDKVEDGVYKVIITGSEANLPTKVGSSEKADGYTYTFTLKVNNALTKTFNVTIRKPIVDNGAYVISGYKVEFDGATDIKTLAATTEAVKECSNSATLYLLSNGVKADVLKMTQKPASKDNTKVGDYYYTISKNGAVLDLAEPEIGLTKFDPVRVTDKVKDEEGAETEVVLVDGLLVNKGANGVGNYTIVIYRGDGKTAGATASTLTQVTSNTLTVNDTQDVMSYAGKMKNSHAVATVADIVMDCFKFTIGGVTLDSADDYVANDIIVVPQVNKIDTNKDGMPDANTVCFVNSVDFYKLVGVSGDKNVYVKYNVAVNNYVEVK